MVALANEPETTSPPLRNLPEFLNVDRNSPEWRYMWGQLDDPAAYCPTTGEVWQYMGSFRSGDRYFHEFRHRSHPVHRDRVIKKIPASEEHMERVRLAACAVALIAHSCRPC
jgi:hypothetical protein